MKNEKYISLSRTVVLRPLTIDAHDALLWTFMEDAHGPYVAKGALPRERFVAHLGESRMREPCELWLVCHEAQREPIGFVDFRVTGRLGHLSDIYLVPRMRARGIGALVLRAVEEMMVGRGASVASLNVFEENGAARRFYHQAGWTAVGTRSLFSPNDQIVMLKRFVLARAVDASSTERV